MLTTMPHVSVQSESINDGYCRETPPSCSWSLKWCFGEVGWLVKTHTHTQYFWSTQNIYCKDFYCFLKLEWALIQSLYHVINKCNGLHKCRKEPDKKKYIHTICTVNILHIISTHLYAYNTSSHYEERFYNNTGSNAVCDVILTDIGLFTF